MKDLLAVIVTVAGGLGVFLLGMKHLSEGLQAVGGRGLRKFMGLATTHRMAGVGTGIVSTLIVQSSSIISVMLVGFVASGMMSLQQAINVIIGANTLVSKDLPANGVYAGNPAKYICSVAEYQEKRAKEMERVPVLEHNWIYWSRQASEDEKQAVIEALRESKICYIKADMLFTPGK